MTSYHQHTDCPASKAMVCSTSLARGRRTLKLHRFGRFYINVAGHRHCGPAVPSGRMPMDYEVEVECSADDLDPNGFLIEQLGIHQYFLDLGHVTTRLSCELLAIQVALDMHSALMRENVSCEAERIAVKLTPVPTGARGASMTFEWRASAGPITSALPRNRIPDPSDPSDPMVWTTADNRQIRLRDMDGVHLARSFRYVVEHDGYDGPRAQAFLAEMRGRANPNRSR